MAKLRQLLEHSDLREPLRSKEFDLLVYHGHDHLLHPQRKEHQQSCPVRPCQGILGVSDLFIDLCHNIGYFACFIQDYYNFK